MLALMVAASFGVYGCNDAAKTTNTEKAAEPLPTAEDAKTFIASEVFWRWHFALGSCVFTMVSSKALSEIAEAEYQQHMEIEDLIRKVITYIAAGFSAPKTS